VSAQFVRKPTSLPTTPNGKSAKVSNFFLSIPYRLSKENLAKSKYISKSNTNKKSYTQASKSNVEDIIHIKNEFPNLSTKKVVKINDIVNKTSSVKPRINMTTKGPSRKQIIIPMSKNNAEVISNHANYYIININKCFKKAKSNTVANFICLENYGIIITTSQAASAQDMSVIENISKKLKILI